MLIYCATNKMNGKRYVGYTTTSLDERIDLHVRAVKSRSKTHFHNAIRAHGFENFVWTILENGIKDFESLKRREIYWITELNTFKGPGYNMTEGGDGFTSEGARAVANRPDVKEKKSKWAIERYKDPKERERSSELQKIAQNRPEVRKRNSEIQLARYKNKEEHSKTSVAVKKAWSCSEMRRRQSKRLIEYWKCPGARELHSKKITERYKDPQERKRTSDATKRGKNIPGAKEIQSKKAKEVWSRPGMHQTISFAVKKAWQCPKLRESVSGENSLSAKLTWDIVRQIRDEYVSEKTPYWVLAQRYDVTSATICAIIKNKTWRSYS